MNQLKTAVTFFLLLMFQSCNPSLPEYATDWSINIKKKIIEDANQTPDKIIFDSTSYNITSYKGDKKLKFYHLNPKVGSNGKLLYIDTAASIFYSTDQNFALIRELCPAIRSFEGLRYKGESLGLVELKYCDGKIKETGYRFNGDIGIWKEYDVNGKMINETDHGNIERLEKLKDIKYSR